MPGGGSVWGDRVVAVVALIHATVAELRRDPWMAVGGVLLFAACKIFAGEVVNDPWAAFVVGLTAFMLQFMLMGHALRIGGLVAATRTADIRRFWSFFSLWLVSTVPVLIGFILFVVPGVWLYARWLLAMPILFAEQGAWNVALSRSVARTRPMLGSIVIAGGIIHLPFLIGFVWFRWMGGIADGWPEAVIAMQVAGTVSQVAGWYFAVAVYRTSRSELMEEGLA